MPEASSRIHINSSHFYARESQAAVRPSAMVEPSEPAEKGKGRGKGQFDEHRSAWHVLNEPAKWKAF